tara:strand:- start:197 stop:796 length:600 start_codon:yes stop_codon:yes gene_type:complete
MSITSKNIFTRLKDTDNNLLRREKRISVRESNILRSNQPMASQQGTPPKKIASQFFAFGFKQGFVRGFQFVANNPSLAEGINTNSSNFGDNNNNKNEDTKTKERRENKRGEASFRNRSKNKLLSINTNINSNISSNEGSFDFKTLNKGINSSAIKIAVQPIVRTKVDQVVVPIPITQRSTSVSVVSRSSLPRSVAKMIS